jgi:hypothetical protein
LGEVGTGFQLGVKFGEEEHVIFRILVDIRFFGIPQITCGLITGINFKLRGIYIEIDAGGGFANSKFTTLLGRSPFGVIPRPLGRKTGGVGDLFPHIHKYFKEKSSIPRLAPGILYLNILILSIHFNVFNKF